MFALAIPVIIHLTQRRKFKELKIGTLRFLTLAEKKRNLRMRIEQWPLLLLRMLALALLAFLFARPFFNDRKQTDAAGGKTIVLLDASGSMTSAMKEQALKAAEKIARRDGAVTLAQFSDNVEAIAGLEHYAPVAGAPSDFSGALGWALDHLRSEGVTDAKVVVIGHFAANQMPSSPPRVWPPRVSVEAIAIEPPEGKNQAVKSVELLTPFATAEMEIEARMTASEKEREMKLSAEGLNLTKKIPSGAERVIFSFRPNREEIRGFISLAGNDAWPADDRRPFAMQWAEPESVMIVDGFPGSTPFEGQGYFLEKALAASGAAHGLSPFLPEIAFGLDVDNSDVSQGRFIGPNQSIPTTGKIKTAKEITKFSAFALCGPTALSSTEARKLREAVDRGAGLITILDSRWTPEATAALKDVGLFPSEVTLSGGMQQRRISSWDKDHPAFAAFSGVEGGDMRPLLWRDAFTIGRDDGWKALATLDGGHPILMELKSTNPAHGRVMVLAHPLTREWTDLPRDPIFVPFLKGIFTTLARYEPRQHSANVVTPGIKETREIGYYQSAGGAAEVVAASPDEISVSAIDAEAFRKAFALPAATDSAAAPAMNAHGQNEDGAPREGEWWRWLALGLFLLLILESALATRRPTAQTSTPVGV